MLFEPQTTSVTRPVVAGLEQEAWSCTDQGGCSPFPAEVSAPPRAAAGLERGHLPMRRPSSFSSLIGFSRRRLGPEDWREFILEWKTVV